MAINGPASLLHSEINPNQKHKQKKKSACITSSEPQARRKKKKKQKLGQITCSISFFLLMHSSFLLFWCVWKAWVSIPVPHSPLLLLHCWAVYRGRWAQGSLCVSPSCSADKHILVDSLCSREAAERGRPLSGSFKSCYVHNPPFLRETSFKAPLQVPGITGQVGVPWDR